ncbi:DUF4262 domain-containing protein [Stieleria marina]|uniref:DUF4262 domain-containing protein n=1 Tax=Stieleria marina TaxID=1930275 RepID=A0A517P2A5_9BACT|nr:hypothetical protein K239x_55210 [Planctomycetes bacterium K23_9]
MVRTKPDDESDRKLLADVVDHGWHLVGIDDDDEGPAYVFSVGLFHTLGHPEICLFGLGSTTTMSQIINGIGDLIKSGQTFEDWHESGEILDGYACMFRSVNPSLYREYFGYDLWFYEGPDFPMLQCVWPDRQHNYPWNAEFNSQPQPVLASTSAWQFKEAKNLGVLTTIRVVEAGEPVLLVTHDEDGDWQFLCGTTNDPKQGRLVGLDAIVDQHPSVVELADLPMGWRAEREAPGKPWRRQKQT